MYDYPDYVGNVAGRLLNLRKGAWSVADNAADFKTLVAGSLWNKKALHDVFMKGLSEQLKDELATWEIPSGLQAVVTIVVILDNRIKEHEGRNHLESTCLRRRDRQVCAHTLVMRDTA